MPNMTYLQCVQNVITLACYNFDIHAPILMSFRRPFVKWFAYAIGLLSVCVCLSVCLSAMLVYCGQTVGWINMELGMQVGL